MSSEARGRGEKCSDKLLSLLGPVGIPSLVTTVPSFARSWFRVGRGRIWVALDEELVDGDDWVAIVAEVDKGAESRK